MKINQKTPYLILAVVFVLWLCFLPFFYKIFFTELFYMPFVGVIAATVANITPAAAGIVYFPILTHLNVPPVTAAQFNLIIQAYGMGLGTFRWFLVNKKLFIFNVIPICILGGIIGEVFSIILFPISNPECLTLVFNLIAFLFTQIIFFSLLRKTQYPNTTIELTGANVLIFLFFSFIGGLISGWIGFGIDTIFYFILTVIFRINPAVSIVTSISLMAAMSIVGTVFNFFFHEIPFSIWYSAIPGVTIAGLFFAAYVAIKIGAKNVLLLFTFLLTIDFFANLWTQQTIPMSDTVKMLILYPLMIYMLGIHIKIFRENYRSISCSLGDFKE